MFLRTSFTIKTQTVLRDAAIAQTDIPTACYML
jgi:hypothetical protein